MCVVQLHLYNLQALRHLYVLAVEPRLVAPCCSQSGSLLSLELEVGKQSCQVSSRKNQVCYRATPAHPALSLSVNAPILLPSLHLLSSVAVADPCYWNTKFLPGENDDWPDLRLLLSSGGHMRVKRREGSGWLTKAARLTPWSLGKAQQEKLTGSGGRRDQMPLSLHPTSGHWEAYSQLLLKDCPSAWVSALLCLLSRY